MNDKFSVGRWPRRPLIEVAKLQRGFDLPVQDREVGSVPVFAANGPIGTHSAAMSKGPGVITGRSGTIGKVHYVETEYWPLNTSLFVSDFCGNHPKWVYYMLSAFGLEKFSQGAGVPTLNRNLVHGELVEVPPFEEQQRIAAILDKADSLRRKRQEANRLADQFLRAVFFDMFGDRPKAKVLTDYVDFLAGFAFKSEHYVPPGDGVRLLRGINVGIGRFEWSDAAGYPVFGVTGLDRYRLESGDVVLAMDRPWISTGLKCAVVDERVAGTFLVQRVARLRPKTTKCEMFVFNCLQGNDFKSHCRITETTIPHISPKDFATYPVPNATEDELRIFAAIADKVRSMSAKSMIAGEFSDQLQASMQDKFFARN